MMPPNAREKFFNVTGEKLASFLHVEASASDPTDIKMTAPIVANIAAKIARLK
jgi:hypothetical protein